MVSKLQGKVLNLTGNVIYTVVKEKEPTVKLLSQVSKTSLYRMEEVRKGVVGFFLPGYRAAPVLKLTIT